jgi:MFS family permease
MLGSRVTTIAFPMLVLYLTRSAVYAGFAVFAATAPSLLFYMPAGALVDRWDPRRTMLCNEFLRGVAIGAIVAIILSHKRYVVLIIALAVVEEIFEIFATLAERRCMRILVDPDLASSASARVEARSHFVVLIGRPLGALLFGIDHFIPFFADLVTFAFSCLTLIRIRGKVPTQTSQEPRAQLRVEIGEGWRWLKDDDFLRISIILNSGMTLISQALILVFIAEAGSQHLSSLAIGVILACSGFGGVLGAIFGETVDQVIGSHLRFFQGRSRIKLQLCVWSAGLLVLAVTASIAPWRVPCMSLVMAIFGFSGAMGNMEIETYMTKKVPPEMIARLTSILRLTSFFMFAAGPAIGGSLVGLSSTGIAMWCLFAMVMTLTVFVARNVIKRSWISAPRPVLAVPWRVLTVGAVVPVRPRQASAAGNGVTAHASRVAETPPDDQMSQEGSRAAERPIGEDMASHRSRVMMK